MRHQLRHLPRRQHLPCNRLQLRQLKDLLTNFLPLNMTIEDIADIRVEPMDTPAEQDGQTHNATEVPLYSSDAPQIIRIVTRSGQAAIVGSGPREPRNSLTEPTRTTEAGTSGAGAPAALRTGRIVISARAIPIAPPKPPPGYTATAGSTALSTTRATPATARQQAAPRPSTTCASALTPPGMTPLQSYRMRIGRLHCEVQGLLNWISVNHAHLDQERVRWARQVELRLHHAINLAQDVMQLEGGAPRGVVPGLRIDRSRSPVGRARAE